MFDCVLLLEDDQSHAMLIKRAMRELAAEIVHVETVEQALRALEKLQPELIVSDLRLPDSSGVRHIGELKEKSNDAPIVVLTSSTSLDDAVAALKLGARDFVVKNFNSEFRDVLTLSLSRLFAALELEREKRELMRDLELLRVAIENTSDGLAVVNIDGSIGYSNSGFKNFSSFLNGSPETLQRVFRSSGEKHEQFAETLMTKLGELAPGAVWHTEFTAESSETRTFDISLSAVRHEGEKIKGESVLWVTDITERKRRERFQRELLSTTTHDLKGPLGAISVSVDLLEGIVKSPGRERELILRIGSSAQGVLNLIDEFLSARRIQEGNLLLKPVLQKVAPVVKEVLGNYENIAAAKKIQLVREPIDENLLAMIDAPGVGRVLGNLVSNALKFTPSGGEVRVSASGETDGLHLVVEDTGTGMEPSDVQRIFERFSRLDKHSNVAGTGLGLFVVKSIVNAYGGKIEVTSRVDSGTTFVVVLPENPPVNERGELVSLDFA